MIHYYDFLLIGSLFTIFITSIILFTRGYQQNTNRMLGVVIFGWGWYGLIYLLVVTGWLIHVPVIHRMGSPFYYLIPACGYLYVRNVLLDENRFRLYDLLHFLPAIFHFVELLPYHLSGLDNKRSVVHAILNNFNLSFQLGDGLIPAFWHFQLRWILGVIYVFFQWRLLYKVLGKDDLRGFKLATNWLVLFTLSCTAIYAGLGSMSILAWMNLGSEKSIIDSGRSIPMLLQVVSYVFLSVYLFFKPEILYGIPRKMFVSDNVIALTKEDDVLVSEMASSSEVLQNNSQRSSEREIPFNPQLIEGYADQIVKYIKEEEPFVKKGFTINDLSQSLKMPIHHLSYILNHYYNQRFTDFINSYRVNYVISRMDCGDWRSLTLEALASDAGFSSRSTFFVAFKKVTGMSPSQYLQQSEIQ